MEEDEIYEKKKLTEEDKNQAIKEYSIFALVAFFLYVFQLVLPPVLHAIVSFIHSFTK